MPSPKKFERRGCSSVWTSSKPRRAALEQVLSDEAPPPVRMHPNLAQAYREKVEQLQEAFAKPEDRDEAMEMLRRLIERVVVHRAEEGPRIKLHGELAGILGLCREGRRGGRLDAETLAQIKVVAGGGFEPPTFRL